MNISEYNETISSFEEYNNLPYINKLGIIHNLDDDKYYPLFESKMDSLIIDEKEILLITGWVPIWEVVDIALFSNTTSKGKRRIIKKLYESEIIENINN